MNCCVSFPKNLVETGRSPNISSCRIKAKPLPASKAPSARNPYFISRSITLRNAALIRV